MTDRTRTRPRIYICGPFRAESEYARRANVARAEAAALEVARAGAWYRCPHLHSAHFDGVPGLDDAYWLGLGLDLLAECDAAYLVPDAPDAGPSPTAAPWRHYLVPGTAWTSGGSLREVEVCDTDHRPVLQDAADLAFYLASWRHWGARGGAAAARMGSTADWLARMESEQQGGQQRAAACPLDPSCLNWRPGEACAGRVPLGECSGQPAGYRHEDAP